MILPIERAEHCRGNNRNATDHSRQVIVSENRWGIATARAQLVFRDLLSAWRLAVRCFDLLRSESLGQRVKVYTRISAICLWTNCSVSIFVDTAELTFCFEIVVGICAAGKMLRDDA